MAHGFKYMQVFCGAFDVDQSLSSSTMYISQAYLPQITAEHMSTVEHDEHVLFPAPVPQH